jgi:hypothetical protein
MPLPFIRWTGKNGKYIYSSLGHTDWARFVADLQQGSAGGCLGEAADDSDPLFNALEEVDSSFHMEDFYGYYVQGQKTSVKNEAKLNWLVWLGANRTVDTV